MKSKSRTGLGMSLRDLALLLLLAATSGVRARGAESDVPTLLIDGNPVSTSRTLTRIGEEWMLPLLPVADALGVAIQIAEDRQSIQARHRDGAVAVYDCRSGEVRHGYTVLGRVQAYRKVQILGPGGELMFPLTGVVALLGVDAYEDRESNVLRIESRRRGMQIPAGAEERFRIYDLNYRYALSSTGRFTSQNLDLRGEALAASTRVQGNLLLTRLPAQGLLASQIGLRADITRNSVLLLGDQATYSGIEALSSAVRGAGFQQQQGSRERYLYAGQSLSGSFSTAGNGFPRYDTRAAGFAYREQSREQEFSLAGHLFDGPDRAGAAAGMSYGRVGARNQFKAQLTAGHFSGLASLSSSFQIKNQVGLEDPRCPREQTGSTEWAGSEADGCDWVPSDAHSRIHVNGPALGFSLADTYSPIRQISITGLYDYYGRNFLTPGDNSRYNGNSQRSVSVQLRPERHISLHGGAGDRQILLGDNGGTRNYNYGADAQIPGLRAVQLGYFRSWQKDEITPGGNLQLTQYSVSVPSAGRFSGYASYSEMQLSDGVYKNVSASVTADMHGYGSVSFRNQVQSGGIRRAGADWQMDWVGRRGWFRFGMDRIVAPHGAGGFAVTGGLAMALPGGQNLQVTYTRDRNTHQFQLELGGLIRRHPELARNEKGQPALILPVTLSGQVYFDVKNDGEFAEGVDKPVQGIQVRLDGELTAVTDNEGRYRFEKVDPGAHTLRADLSGVPADMVYAEQAERTLAVVPAVPTQQDFRLLRTGRILGRVTCLESGADPDNPVRRLLPDARIVAGARFDTFTELNGTFVLGDLPPGTYRLQLDSESVPAGYAVRPAWIDAEVKPGSTLQDLAFELHVPPKPVVERRLPAQELGVSAATVALPVASTKAVGGGKPLQTVPAPSNTPQTPVSRQASASPAGGRKTVSSRAATTFDFKPAWHLAPDDELGSEPSRGAAAVPSTSDVRTAGGRPLRAVSRVQDTAPSSVLRKPDPPRSRLAVTKPAAQKPATTSSGRSQAPLTGKTPATADFAPTWYRQASL